ncbi:MAG: OmpA family protein, partial [Bacteroidales bacterium]|nr:OmpA family protein [Bacteroidales bacterium]
PRELAYVALQRIISPSLIDNNWKNAIDTLNKYKIYFNNDKRIDKILNILADSDKKLKAQSISENINSTAHEYAPVITFDNKTIYFCGRNREKNIGGEDIFVSKFINGQWSEPELINGVNTPYAHEAPLAISADGNTLIIYYDKDIYYSDKIQPGWTQPRKFPSINIDYSWEADAMLSSNGKAILFISDRKDNIGQHHVFGQLFHGSHKGNLDIYVSTKTEDGWSEPINLGEKINTPYGERSPFLHPDMKTLYFSSEGHAGLGNLDVFKSTRLNDTSWIEWSEPVNLGKELNSYGDEYDYKISTYGQFAFFSSYKDENFDIQKMEIPTSMQPDKIVLISGNIKNTIGEPVKATVKWEDLKTGKIMGFSESDLTDDGKFLVILPQGKNYGYFIEHKNYYPLSGNIDLTEQKDQAEIIQNFTLISYVEIINNQHIIPLKNVFFNHNQSKLKAESYSELNRLILFIKKNHDLKIEISGHTDNSGTSNYNMKLSQKRAEAVLQYLVKNGCKSSNLVAKGYGETKPVDDNETDEGKSKNRRVEFKVLK